MGADNINHPDHFQLTNGQEAMDMIIALMGNPTDFCIGETQKHVIEWYNRDKKNPDQNGTEDLENAVWYLQYLIAWKKGQVKKQIDEFTAKVGGGYGQ